MNKKILAIYVLSGSIFFCQGIEALPLLAVTLWLKETLHMDASTIMYLTGFISISFFIKPLFGLFIDNYLSNRHYIIGAYVISIVAVIAVCTITITSVALLITMLIIIDTCACIRNISIDGDICIVGNAHNDCSRIQAIQWGCYVLSTVIVGLVGGYLADHYHYRVGYVLLMIIYIAALIVAIKYKTGTKSTNNGKFLIALKSYKELIINKKFLFCAALVFVFNFMPKFATPILFIERDTFHWSATFIGLLTSVDAIISIGTCLLYFKFSKKLNLYKCFIVGIFLNVILTLGYLYYTPITGIVYALEGGILMFFFLVCNTYMAKNVLEGKETTSFALLCSVSNISGILSTLSGAYLFDLLGLTWVIIIAALCPLFSMPLLKFINKRYIMH